MDGIFKRENTVAITRVKDIWNSDSLWEETVDLYRNQSMSDMGIDSNSSSFDCMLAHALISQRKFDDSTLRKMIKSAQNGDDYAKDLIFNSNALLSFHVLRKYFTGSPYEEDLIQEGNIAILNAVMDYDVESEAKFSTFAYTYIKNRMLVFLKQVKPKVTSYGPDNTLRKYISTTELNNLVNNFVDESDLRKRIERFGKATREKIVKYVLERQITVISFEEYEEEIEEEIANSTQRNYVSTVNWVNVDYAVEFYKQFKLCALTIMSKRRFDIYCEFNGLFGYDPPIDREKRLKELGIGISALRAIETAILYRICLNEEFRPYLGELFRKEVNSRGYYYERI